MDRQTVCYTNGAAFHDPRIHDALKSILSAHVPTDLVDSFPEDNSDLQASGLFSQDLLLNSSADSDKDELCSSAECRFDSLRFLARSRRHRPGCFDALIEQACLYSPWRALVLHERLEKIWLRGRPFAERFGVDVRALPCIAARETNFLEPLTLTSAACEAETSDEGLGQIIWPTFRYYYKDLHFRISSINDQFVDAEHVSDVAMREVFFRIGQSVDAQLELMAFTLAEKRSHANSSEQAFENYNGSLTSALYGRSVQACYDCMVDRVNPKTFAYRGDPLRCLSRALGPRRDIVSDFSVFHAFCGETQNARSR